MQFLELSCHLIELCRNNFNKKKIFKQNLAKYVQKYDLPQIFVSSLVHHLHRR